MISPDNSRKMQALAAANSIRETAKWLAGAFSALGVALLAGAQFARIGSLDSGRLVVAVIAFVSSLACVFSALKLVTDILKPLEVKEGDLSSPEYGGKVNERLNATPSGIKSVADLRSELARNAAEHDKVIAELNVEQTAEVRAMLEARDRVHYENDSKMRGLHDELMATVAYWMLSDRFMSTRKYLFLVATLATVGIGFFVWASSSPFKVGTVGGPKLTINLNGADGVASSDLMFDKIGASIGPFQTGQNDRLEGEPPTGAAGICASDPVKSINGEIRKKGIRLLLAIGSADKFDLSSSLRAKYGSNDGLAQARADQIVDCLSQFVSPDITITTVRGPSVYGSVAKSSATGRDRSVTVYIIWAKNSDRKP